jgi:hypothetical protein
MTSQRELDRLLDAFLAEGHDELADRVIDDALDQIDHTPQRRVMHMPRRLQTMPMLTRVAAAAVIGVIAVGGAFYLMKPGESSGVGGPGPTTATPIVTPAPTPAATPAPTPTPIAALTGPIGAGRQIHTSTVLADGRVLVAGGYALGDGPLASASLYDPATNTFSQARWRKPAASSRRPCCPTVASSSPEAASPDGSSPARSLPRPSSSTRRPARSARPAPLGRRARPTPRRCSRTGAS